MKVLCAHLGALLVLGLPATAAAEGVAVLGYRAAMAPTSADAPRDALAAVLRSSGRTPITDAFARARRRVATGAVPRQRLRAFRRAQELLDEGWRAYLAVNRNFAASRLGEARRLAEDVSDLPGGPALLGEISLRLGVVMIDVGQAERAGELFRLAAALDPDREVTTAELPPDVVAAHAAAVAESPARLPITVTVGDGGPIEIDGVVAGVSPLRTELSVGQHLIVGRGATARDRGIVFETRLGGASSIDIALDDDAWLDAIAAGLPALEVGRAEEDATNAARALGVYAEVEAVVLVASVWRHGGPALLGQLCNGAEMRCGPVVEVGYGATDQLAAAARELWAGLRRRGTGRGFPPTLLVDQRLVRGESAPGGTTPPIVPGRAWWQHPYLWIGAASVAVGVGAAVLLTRDDEPALSVGGSPCDFVTCP